MALVDNSKKYVIYFTQNARKDFIGMGNNKNKISYFSFSDEDIDYNNIKSSGTSVSDISGDRVDCIYSLSNCYNHVPSIKTTPLVEEQSTPLNVYPFSNNGTFENITTINEYVRSVPPEAENPEGATLTPDLTIANFGYNSSKSMKFSIDGGFNNKSAFLRSTDKIDLEPNTTYELTSWVYIPNGYSPITPNEEIEISIFELSSIGTFEDMVGATYTYVSKFDLTNDTRNNWKRLKTIIETTSAGSGYFTLTIPNIVTPDNQELVYIDNIELLKLNQINENTLTNPIEPLVVCNTCEVDNMVDVYVEISKINNSQSINAGSGHLLGIIPNDKNITSYDTETPITYNGTSSLSTVEDYIDWYIDYIKSLSFLTDISLSLPTTNENIWQLYPYTFFTVNKENSNTIRYSIDLNFWYTQFLMQDNVYVNSDKTYVDFVIDPNNLNKLDFYTELNQNPSNNIVVNITHTNGLDCLDFSDLDDKFIKDCYYPLYLDLYIRQTFNEDGLSLVGRDICDRDSYSTCN